mgnify:CR=1 FL=1
MDVAQLHRHYHLLLCFVLCAEQLGIIADQGYMRLRHELGLSAFVVEDNATVSAQDLPLEQLSKFMQCYGMFATALLLPAGTNTSDTYNSESNLRLLYPTGGTCQLPMHMSRAGWPLKLRERDMLESPVVKQDDSGLLVPTDPLDRAYHVYTAHGASPKFAARSQRRAPTCAPCRVQQCLVVCGA